MICNRRAFLTLAALCCLSAAACSSSGETLDDSPSQTPEDAQRPEAPSPDAPVQDPAADTETPDLSDTPDAPATAFADVTAVQTSGGPESWTLEVSVASPDTGCEAYADWWEVTTLDGELLYRRILLHSHVGEQPFTRSGGPVAIGPGQDVLVRAHFNPTGYGGQVMKGHPTRGFVAADIPSDFAPQLAQTAPLPEGCNF